MTPKARQPWRRAVLMLFAVSAGTNVPTPLLLIYKDSLHLSAQTLTALFGCYAAGLLLGQYAPFPTALPYLVHVALVGVGLAAARGLPETVNHQLEERSARDPLLRKGDGRRFVTVVAPLAVCVYAFPSVVISALPVLIDLPHGSAVALTGVLAGVTLGASTLAAPLQKRLRHRTPTVAAATGAAATGAAGYGIALVAARHDAIGLLVPGALLLGAGGGLALASGLALVAELAPASRRGALTGVFLACAYLGFSAPFLTAVAATHGGPTAPLAIASGLSLLLAFRLAVHSRQP